MEILEDYYFILDVTDPNIGDIELMTQEADNDLPNGCFEVNTEDAECSAVLEFFLSATINSSPEGVKATKISLRKDGVVVAVA